MTEEQFIDLSKRVELLEAKSLYKYKLDERLLSATISRSRDTIYRAATNVIVYYTVRQTAGTALNMNFKTDTSSTPSTIVWTVNNTSATFASGTMTYFVPKGNYYNMVTTSSNSPTEVYQEISLSKYHD